MGDGGRPTDENSLVASLYVSQRSWASVHEMWERAAGRGGWRVEVSWVCFFILFSYASITGQH